MHRVFNHYNRKIIPVTVVGIPKLRKLAITMDNDVTNTHSTPPIMIHRFIILNTISSNLDLCTSMPTLFPI